MNQMNEVQAFITSLFHTKFDDLDLHAIEKHIRSVKETTPSVSRSNSGGWQSPIFQSYDSPEIERLFEDRINFNAFGLINYVMKHARSFSKVEYWYNVNTPNSFNMPHVHPRSILAGVLYVKVPKNSGKT